MSKNEKMSKSEKLKEKIKLRFGMPAVGKKRKGVVVYVIVKKDFDKAVDDVVEILVKDAE